MNKTEYNKKRLEQCLKGKDCEIGWEEWIDLIAFGVTPHADECVSLSQSG